MQPIAELGPLTPQTDSPRIRTVCRRILAAAGWSIEGKLPDRSKFVVIAAPHTSNWDFCVAMLVIGALGLQANWLAKHTLFRWPMGRVMRLLGGLPVERTQQHGVVGHAIKMFMSEEKLVLAITPEGTRRHVTRWKTGFYHIAVGAGVPVVPAYLDYTRQVVGFGDMVWLGDDMDKALTSLQAYYARFAQSGRRPELYGSGQTAIPSSQD